MKWQDRIKGFIFLLAAFALIGGLALLINQMANGHPKSTASPEQVWEVLEDQGYDPFDSLQPYKEKWTSIKDKINTAITVQKDDLQFNFFVFDSKETAEFVWGHCYSYIRWNRYDSTNLETWDTAANYHIYTITAAGMYSVCIRIDNTLIFAYSNEENKTKIDDIRNAIDYF